MKLFKAWFAALTFFAVHSICAAQTPLPLSVTDVFKKANVPLESVAVYIKEVTAREPLISINVACA